MNKEVFKVGPIGSNTCKVTSWDENGRTRISNIYVTYDDRRITSIQFSYFQNGAHVVYRKHGSSQGHKFEIIRLKENEYVTGLSGIDWESKITSLTFHTNQRKHGPICDIYGDLPSQKREIDVKIRDLQEFGGFFGSFCDTFGLTTIGIYVSPSASKDVFLRTNFEATSYNHQLALGLLPNHTAAITHNRTHDYQTPKIVDGFPVKSIRYKPKLKDRILSKLDFKKAILNLLKKIFD